MCSVCCLLIAIGPYVSQSALASHLTTFLLQNNCPGLALPSWHCSSPVSTLVGRRALRSSSCGELWSPSVNSSTFPRRAPSSRNSLPLDIRLLCIHALCTCATVAANPLTVVFTLESFTVYQKITPFVLQAAPIRPLSP